MRILPNISLNLVLEHRKENKMENYKEKYEDALERARVWKEKSGMPVDKQGILDDIFPELKERDDEKIRKELIRAFTVTADKRDYEIYGNGITYRQVLAWLEKQGEQKPIISEDAIREGVTHFGITQYQITNWLKKYIDVVKQKPTDKIQLGKKYKCVASPKYSTFMIGRVYKPEDKFLCSLMNFCSNCFEPIEDGEQKSTDKAEPEFKIEKGHWYVCIQSFVLKGNTVVIKGRIYKSQEDNTISGEKARLFIDKHDGDVSHYFRPWTIQDAKDGDVLAFDWKDSWQWQKIVIFKSLNESGVEGYGNTFKNNELAFKEEVPYYSKTWTKCLYPATKEQRELLFQKMKEAGYEWDAEKKELKKIKQTYFQKQEWTGYDEKAYEIALLDIDKSPSITKNDTIDWLKSLKNRVQSQSN